MARQKTPDLLRAKQQVLQLPDDDAVSLYEWLGMLLEVREQEAERKAKKDFNAHLGASPAEGAGQ